jgi:hypothetical protein
MVKSSLITVVETASFLADAKACMTDEERTGAITMIAANPECGDLVPGGGGIRKVRFAIGGRGKSGGVRIIYYFHSERVPIFLLSVFAKNERANLTRSETNMLGAAAKMLARKYGE